MKSLDYTCLFGGGAIRGVAYVGAVKALEEIGIKPNNIAGSSVGSIVSALLAVGYSADELKQIFLDVNFDLFKDFHLALGPKFALSKGELFLDWVRELIESKFYGENYSKGKNKAVTFNDIKKNLIIITTDLSNFGCKEFSKSQTPDFEIASAVRISCSMPGLMKPVEYNNTLLVDGDLQKSMPMWKLSKNMPFENERVLEFRLEGDFDGTDKNALDYMNTIYTCITAMCTSYIANTYGKKDKFDYIVINTGDVIVVDFNYPKEKREELIENGYRQTIDYFKKQLPLKKDSLLTRYYSLDKSLKYSKKLLEKKKIAKTKQSMCEMFVNLCEDKEFIDSAIFKKIKQFYKEFTKNIKHPALFGKASLKNYDDLLDKFSHIVKEVDERIYEMESYLIKFPI